MLRLRCVRCGADIAAGKKFCGDCGALLAETPTVLTEPEQVAQLEETEGERRHLTVLFSDLVNSTGITGRLDPEEWREIAESYQKSVSDAVARFGGHVAQYLGDGVLAYFGWPEAHDNDAERATRAGLAILGVVAERNHALLNRYGVNLATRVGIHTGEVVIGENAGKGANIFGEVPNIASRVQTAAEPGTVFVTSDAHRLVSGMFIVEDRGAQTLKGVQRPVRLYRVVQPTGARGRLGAVAAARGLTPFVGREDELRLLASRWELARSGEGQVALIVGEAGIGKSRLAQQSRELIAGTPHTWVECDGSPYFQNTPFYPISQMLQQGFGWRAGQSAEEKLAGLERNLELAGVRLPEAVPLLTPLLNLPLQEKYPPLLMPPEQQRRRLLATLVAWVIGTARSQPVVIAIEDLQWVDPSTLELIQLLGEQGATSRLLLIYTARPEFRVPWPMRSHHTQLTLNRLSARDVREMVARVSAHISLSDETVAAVVERTGGVPLFVEELTRVVLENSGRLLLREIPVTLQDLLTARLDRLGAAKEIAQIAAVIGREFSYELLRALARVPERDLQTALAKLADAELLYVRGIAPEATYTFKHALIQDAAYEALLKSRRRQLHRRVAQALVDHFPATAEAQPEVLARHWTDAGDASLAIAAWRRAGDAARARCAFKEAEEIYRQALALLSTQTESPDRDAVELKLVSAFAGALQVTKGYAVQETVNAIARVRALAEKSGQLAHLVPQMNGAFAAAIVSGDLAGASAIADQMLELARREGGAVSLGYAHMDQVNVRYYRGDLIGAEDHFERGSPYFAAPAFQRFPAAAATAFNLASLNAWTIGRSATALERNHQAFLAARANNSAYNLAYAQFIAAWLHCLLGEPEKAETFAAEAVAICDERGFPHFGALGRTGLGMAIAQRGRAHEGVQLIRTALATLAEIRAPLGMTQYLTLLAEAQALDGETVDALNTIEQCLQSNSEELAYRPETLRLRGQLRLKEGQIELAVADFREAIAIARKCGAKAWELRAAMSLVRTLAPGNARTAARDLLATLHASFTEGLATKDLVDAKALLGNWAKT
jgi:class 3 adenylate cyclase/tetratricopeptide (TPR) repeat protein